MLSGQLDGWQRYQSETLSFGIGREGANKMDETMDGWMDIYIYGLMDG